MLSRNKSPVMKRGVVARGHRTSVSLEEAFWDGLKEIAAECRLTLTDLIAHIDATRETTNLSSAIRVFVLAHFQEHCSALAERAGTAKSKCESVFQDASY